MVRFKDPFINKNISKFRKGDKIHHRNTPNLTGTVVKGNFLGYGTLNVKLDYSGVPIIYDVKDVIKESKNKYISRDIKFCPYCGSEEYYIRQSFKGTCYYHIRFDGKETENGEMYDNTQYKNISKYAWCNKCGKRLFKIED